MSDTVKAFFTDALQGALEVLRTGAAPLFIAEPRRKGERLPGYHFHPYHEIMIQMTGQLSIQFPQEQFTLGPGHIAVLGRLQPHADSVVGEPFATAVFRIRPTEGLYLRVDTVKDGFPAHSELCEYASPYARLMRDAMTALFEIRFGPHHARQHGVSGALMFVLAELLNAMASESIERPQLHPKVVELERLVIMNVDNPALSTKWLARRLGMSADYLSHLYRSETSRTVTEYINLYRTRHACELLETSTMSVADVAACCGYSSSSYFIQVFRRFNNITPAAYREKISGEPLNPAQPG